jgi:hypothetical protein
VGVLFGFFIGYLFGTQAGHEGFTELVDAVTSISSSGQLKEVASEALSSILDRLVDS